MGITKNQRDPLLSALQRGEGFIHRNGCLKNDWYLEIGEVTKFRIHLNHDMGCQTSVYSQGDPIRIICNSCRIERGLKETIPVELYNEICQALLGNCELPVRIEGA